MSSAELDFEPDELAMLRDLFRGEAQAAIEGMTARVLAAGSSVPAREALTEMMRATHTLKGAAGTVGLMAMVELAHRLEDAFAAFAREPGRWTAATGDVVVEVLDALRSYVDVMAEPGAEAAAEQLRVVIEQLMQVDREPAAVAAKRPAPTSGAAMARTGASASPSAPGADAEPTNDAGDADAVPEVLADAVTDVVAVPEVRPVPEAKALVRVEAERLDEVMASAGALLFDRTRIERRVQLLRTLARDLARTRQALHDALGEEAGPRGALSEADSELAAQAAVFSQTTSALLEELEALRRTVGELQGGLMRIRMESAHGLMLHAARTLRALRRATGAEVELRTYGEATELDKSVAEQLMDPVTQLLRNAVAHGIEPADERVARGKPPVAIITIRARQDGNSLVLEIADDGRGIDTAAVSARLVASGRWSAARARLANDADVLSALLDTGVSTRGEADELAGRGVGIGLVRETVARLGGEVHAASLPGQGTTFTLRLPASATLGHAKLFKVEAQVYALPSVHVADTMHVDGLATTAVVGDVSVPVVRLERLLGEKASHGASDERRPALVVSFAGRVLVCTVDRVLGAREIIIRPLGPLLAPLTLYAGATISGSGKVQLILDPAQLVRRAYPDALMARPGPGHGQGHGSGSSMSGLALAGRALVVDDSPAIREAMTSMLGSEGWIVDVAEDGGRALQMAQQLRYDLVVTDLEMQPVSGFELIARMRGDARLRDTPVVVITSRASPEHRRRARDLGVRALVAKPITRRKLLEAIAAR